MKDGENRRLCDFCGKPLDGHCLFLDLGAFCESCVRSILTDAMIKRGV